MVRVSRNEEEEMARHATHLCAEKLVALQHREDVLENQVGVGEFAQELREIAHSLERRIGQLAHKQPMHMRRNDMRTSRQQQHLQLLTVQYMMHCQCH